MKYLKPRFTLPAAPSQTTQERWNEIFGSVENKEVSDPQNARRFDMSAPMRFDTPEHIALSQADGWASDGQMAGGNRQGV